MSPALDEAGVRRVLGATGLFAALKPDVLGHLAAACTQRRYGRGQFLCHQGDRGDRLFIIAEGTVKVSITSFDGVEVVLATLGAHESFGELAVLDGAPRSASVVAMEPTHVLMMHREELLDLMSRHPSVLDAMLRSLGALVRRLTEQTGDFVFLDLGGRLAKVLLRLAPPDSDGLRVSQSDLAAMVGATRPAVNRALQMMAARSWISVSGQQVTLHDRDALRRRAGL